MQEKQINIGELMGISGVKFGTSGARGLVADMTDEVCYAYTQGFLQHLEATGELRGSGPVGVSGDLRPSTDRIMAAASRAIADKGYQPVQLGKLPSPAVACWGLSRAAPTVMVTGSHIPDDRNGIKYTKQAGEILKPDEVAMRRQLVTIEAGFFDQAGRITQSDPAADPVRDGLDLYLSRYLDFFPKHCLDGKKIGLFQHSAVGRELMQRIYEGLGAQVVPLGWSDTFIPVDTEAIRPEDVQAARQWARADDYFAILSTDGDSDRPLIADENGKWMRGDVAGILCAAWLGADAVVTPVSCNSAVEKSDLFERVVRTRIGSPYVIEAMQQARADGFTCVVGYEANGGFLIETPIQRFGGSLTPLPTRDAIILHLAIMLAAIEKDVPISRLVADLPQRFTHSDRLKEFPTEKSKAKISELYAGVFGRDRAAIEQVFGASFGRVTAIDATDGVRITFDTDEVVHLRPSGNAPEFRCYTEADTESRAAEINRVAIAIMATWR